MLISQEDGNVLYMMASKELEDWREYYMDFRSICRNIFARVSSGNLVRAEHGMNTLVVLL